MSDSSSFSSLSALVDNHLSKCCLDDSQSDEAFGETTMINMQKALSEAGHMPTQQRLPIPSFNLGSNPTMNVLTQQFSNMYKAKELKEQQEIEQAKLQEEMKKLNIEENSCAIDLSKSVLNPQITQCQWESNLRKFNSLLKANDEFCIANDIPLATQIGTLNPKYLPPPEIELTPILIHNMKAQYKGSSFARVITSRVRSNAAPYLKKKHKTNTSIIPCLKETLIPPQILEFLLHQSEQLKIFKKK